MKFSNATWRWCNVAQNYNDTYSDNVYEHWSAVRSLSISLSGISQPPSRPPWRGPSARAAAVRYLSSDSRTSCFWRSRPLGRRRIKLLTSVGRCAGLDREPRLSVCKPALWTGSLKSHRFVCQCIAVGLHSSVRIFAVMDKWCNSTAWMYFFVLGWTLSRTVLMSCHPGL